eukprot:3939015-Heterocapsa_arctica.AAC.1
MLSPDCVRRRVGRGVRHEALAGARGAPSEDDQRRGGRQVHDVHASRDAAAVASGGPRPEPGPRASDGHPRAERR